MVGGASVMISLPPKNDAIRAKITGSAQGPRDGPSSFHKSAEAMTAKGLKLTYAGVRKILNR
jgi:hypothetical protein